MKPFLTILLFSLAIVGMGYFLPRSEFFMQLALFSLSFIAYFFLVYTVKNKGYSFIFIFFTALFLRFLLLGSMPVLSDDFYRFFFDGQLLKLGINPYASLPAELLVNGTIPENIYWETLLSKMNSPNYFSVYPPLHQLFFWVSTWVGEDLFFNILSLRSIIVLFEMINIWLIKEILSLLKLPKYRLAWYAFNPLVIIELTGNLHFEGLVLTGLLMGLYFYCRQNAKKAAIGWSLAAALKLSPLLTAPVWLKAWGKTDFRTFALISFLSLVLFLSPILAGGHLMNFYTSFRLYQSNFEFNASIYYVLRYIGTYFLGYNPIGTLGPTLNFLAAFFLLWIGLAQKKEDASGLAANLVWMYLIFLLLQTTIHPWYLIPALGISVFTTNYLFIGWSGLVFLSYHAYSDQNYNENLWIVFAEYFLLFLLGIFLLHQYYPTKWTKIIEK